MKQTPTWLGSILVIGVSLAAVATPAAGGAVTFKNLHSFLVLTNGSNPNALVQGGDGTFYGTTSGGGTNGGYGTVFKITTNGELTTLHAFAGRLDGSAPNALVRGNDGSFYSTSQFGGSNDLGTVFRVSTNGALTTLFSFVPVLRGHGGPGPPPPPSHFSPLSVVITQPPQSLPTLPPEQPQFGLNYTNVVGQNPTGPLVQGSDGNLYGTTTAGGTNGVGTVFMISTNGTAVPLYSFTGGADGNSPNGLALGEGGELFGTTQYGGSNGNYGTVFKISSDGLLTTLHTFGSVTNGANGSLDGQNPGAALTLDPDGNFYGATRAGGVYGFGTIFRLAANGTLTTLHSFTATSDGSGPATEIVRGVDGNYYGVAQHGSDDATATIFAISPEGSFVSVYSFPGSMDGSTPNGLTQGRDGNLYGTTQDNLGTIFKITPQGALTTLYTFNSPEVGNRPVAALLLSSDGNFYGTTASGGTNNFGTVFRFTPRGALTTLYTFGMIRYSITAVDGNSPVAPLTQGNDGSLYGVTESGGYDGYAGTVFNIGTHGGFTSLYSFTGGPDGNGPASALTFGPDGNLYGAASSGVLFGNGTIFRVSTNGNLTSLYFFPVPVTTNGQPQDDTDVGASGLVWGSDGYFYGTTSVGGDFDEGTVFKITTNGSLTTLYSFTGGIDGSNPSGGLLQASDGNFYGVTTFGGTNGLGTLFSVTPGGSLTSLYSFGAATNAAGNSLDGQSPVAALVQGLDGSFYGTTPHGGAAQNGTLFQLSVGLPQLMPPAIIAQPASETDVDLGNAVSFGALVVGSLPFNYQWQRNGTNLVDEGNVSGANSNILTLRPVAFSDAAAYTLVVSNPYGLASSTVAFLSFERTNASIPAISITSPAPNARTTNLLSGVASDRVGIIGVAYTLTNFSERTTVVHGEAELGPGTTRRTWTVRPLPGMNFITVEAVNYADVSSAAASRGYFYVERASLDMTVTGTGTGRVTGTALGAGDAAPASQAQLNIGETYQASARPASNSLFGGWTITTPSQVISTNRPTIRFIMESNLSLSADFETNLFIAAQGTYNGLYFSEYLSNATVDTAGLLSGLGVRKNGVYSGRLWINDISYAISGNFDAFGNATNYIGRLARQGGPVALEMHFISNAGDLEGSVSGNNAAGPWASELLARRTANVLPSGEYTMVIPAIANSSTNSPGGYGYLLVTNNQGYAHLAGALADGTTLSQSVGVSAEGYVPVYGRLYANTGLLLGWINLQGNAAPDVGLTWIQPARAGSLYKSGFTNLAVGDELPISPWTPPEPASLFGSLTNLVVSEILDATNDLLTFDVTFTNYVLRKVGVLPVNSLTGSVNPKTGLLKVAFGGGNHTPITTGYVVILQNVTNGGGFFVTKSMDGAIQLFRLSMP
jgi:uncharacterized repeat protein (TIGR03803 family)